ncbi:hypothetical protein [Nocardia terpenica]|nr:hypothetical protein [Nocardia terpenica]NQE91697.1 hypothetical protein [Nocardia terpenica]
MSVPRPQWMSPDTATQERAWNAFVTTTAAAVMDAAGLGSPSVDRLLGTEEGADAPATEEPAPVAAILPDPADAVGPLPDSVTSWTAQVLPPLADTARSVVAQIVQAPLP